MKIIILGSSYPLRGGIAHFNTLLFQNLSKKHSVQMINFKRQYPKIFFPGKTQNESGDAGVKIESEILIDSINPFNWIWLGLKLRNRKPNLVIFKYWLPFFGPCFGTISALVKLFTNTKVLAICDNVVPHEKRFGDNIFTRYAFSFTDYFIVQSTAVEKDLLKFLPDANFKNIPHPVYEIFGEKISKSIAKEKLNLKDEKIILFFGYIRKYKGVDVLIDAMKILKDEKIKLLLVGEFYDDEKKYRGKISQNNLENFISVYSDYIPNTEVANYFCAADVVILPYLDATQSGIAQIAYNFNKPVIATDVGGLKEVVIDNFSGLICKSNDATELAKAIKKFYDLDLEEKFSRGAEIEKKKYSWSNLTNAIEGFF